MDEFTSAQSRLLHHPEACVDAAVVTATRARKVRTEQEAAAAPGPPADLNGGHYPLAGCCGSNASCKPFPRDAEFVTTIVIAKPGNL
jgi:hypothetical protein